MRKIVIGLVLVVMAVFSLSAGETLKVRHVDNYYERRATVVLSSLVKGDSTYYFVEWWEEDGSDVVSLYTFKSLEEAYNVWLMSRDKVESISQFHNERVSKTKDGTALVLVRYYKIK